MIAANRTLINNRYELLERLGGGAMADVHRARDTVLNVERALKMVHPNLSAVPQVRSRFLAEAKTLARLEHPNVLRLYDYGQDDGRLYLVTELLTGGSLHDRTVFGPLEPALALEAVFQVLQALAFAHRRGIVHRDVKPGNVLMAEDGSCKLADFGIARVEIDVQHRTRTGASLGTQGYMAPEQRVDARSATPSADLFGAGATLYALLTARTPPVVMWTEALEDVPPACADVIRRSMALSPEQRYPDARQMAVAVARAREAMGLGAAGPWMARFDALLAADVEPALPRRHSRPPGATQHTIDSEPPPSGWPIAAMLAIGGLAAMLAMILALAWAIL